MKAIGHFAAALLSIFAFPSLLCAGDAGEESSARQRIDKLAAGPAPQSRQIAPPGGLAKLNLPDSLRYLSPADAKTVLVSIWGNPPGEENSLGMIVPKGFKPLSQNAWAAEINYEQDGHVKDDE